MAVVSVILNPEATTSALVTHEKMEDEKHNNGIEISVDGEFKLYPISETEIQEIRKIIEFHLSLSEIERAKISANIPSVTELILMAIMMLIAILWIPLFLIKLIMILMS